MVEDTTSEIEVYRCWVCGNRRYVNHPKRSGLLMCSKCGEPVEGKNVLNYCKTCWEGLQIFKKRKIGAHRTPQQPCTGPTGGAEAGIGKRRP